MSELPRLLLCTFDVVPGPTGSSRRLTEYLRELSDHFNVVVLSAKTPDHSHIVKYQGARLLRVPVGTGDLHSRLQAFDRAVRRQLESEEYAVVHFTDPFGGYALCEMRDGFGYKLVYEAQTFPSQELPFTHPEVEGDRRFLARVRRQELFCLMNADRVITGSKVTAAFIQSLGVSAESIEVVRAPVDLEPLTPEALGEPDGAPMRVLYLGSQVAWQGLDTLLTAVEVANRAADVRLTLVGPPSGSVQPLLEDKVQALGLQEKVTFAQPVTHEELAGVLAKADVGVAPLDDLERNRVQGAPLSKVSEYLAAGRPVVAADLPLTRELSPDDATYFYAPEDAEDLGDCLAELAKEPALRVKMGRRAAEYARAHHDSKQIRARLRALYVELAGLSGEPQGEPEDTAAASAPTSLGTPVKKARGEPGTDPEIRRGGRSGSKKKRGNEDSAALRKSRRKAREKVEDTGPGTDPGGPAQARDTERLAPVLPPPLPPDSGDGPEEVDEADVESLDEPPAQEAASRLDAWFAQLVHGYCPPEGAQFARPTPPTNFPGREGPPPATVQPPSVTPQSFPSRSGGG